VARADRFASSGVTRGFEDANFVVGDSPATHNANTALGKNASGGYVVCDGPGSVFVAFTEDGTAYGDNLTVVSDEVLPIPENTHSVKVTWIANSAYRIAVI